VEDGPSGDGDDHTTYDTTNPIAAIDKPADQDTIRTKTFEVDWSGIDPDSTSGIDGYQIQYKKNDDVWTDWYTATTLTSSTFGPDYPANVEFDDTFAFRVRATDKAGNQGEYGPIVTITVERYHIYIPLISKNYSSFTNGSFEQIWSGWSHGGELAQSISTGDSHGVGNHAALLGDPTYECNKVPVGKAWIRQTFSVPPSGVSTMRVWYRIYSQDESFEDEYDRFEIWVNNENEPRLRDGDYDGQWGCGAPHIGNWKSYDIDLTGLEGTNVTIRMENWSWPDGGKGQTDFNTWVYVDDIQLLP
ncbi:MAG: hypothetical protein JXA42_24955, partial [Anaerolineales bacterium]|nr:hypothetical protein [Anaerolineales bacterium]